MSNQRLFKMKTISAGVALAICSTSTFAANPIEEIVVTASKRSQSLQDVSASVSAFNEEAMKKGGIEDLSRLEHMVPGMRFGQSGGEARVAMRGTRTNNVGTEAEQVVGIFEDGVYVPTTTQALGAYVDVKRVEVLRGPQGTLYGKNTFGGTINIVTNEPTFDGITGKINVLSGDYNRIRTEGMLNVPISDTFAVRLAGRTDKRDGYIENTNQVGFTEDLSDKDLQYLRVTAKWLATDNLDMTLRVAVSDEGNNGNAIWGYQQIGGYRDGVYQAGHLFAPADASDDFDQGPWKVARNLQSNADFESTAVTLTANYDFTFAELKVVYNQTDFEGNQNYDSDYSDGGDPINNGFTGWSSAQDTESLEVQLTSSGSGNLDWLIGYYESEQVANWNWQEMVNGRLEEPHWDNQGDYVSESKGVFAHATYRVSDELRLVAGVRRAQDEKQQRDQLDWSVWPPEPIPGSGDAGDWSKTLWKGGIEYDLNQNVMLYGTASTGYRAGGINIVAPNVPLNYDPEEVIAYEVGAKSTLLEGSMILNVAAYANAYKDMHAQSFISLDGGAATEFTENGGELDASGLEIEMQWRPDEHWDISLTAAFMDAEFGEYAVSQQAGLGSLENRQDLSQPGLFSLKGWQPALSPDRTLGLQAGYMFTLAGGHSLTPMIQSTYTSKYYASDFNLFGVEQNAHTKSDARVIFNTADGSWEVQAFVLNLENEAVLNRVAVFTPGPDPTLSSLQAHWNNPRTWGVSASYFFE